MSIKFLILGGGMYFGFFWGGGSADFIFMGAGIFLKSSLKLCLKLCLKCGPRTFKNCSSGASGGCLHEGRGVPILFSWARGFF